MNHEKNQTTFFSIEPHNGCLSKSDVWETIPLGNASIPEGLH